MSLEDFEVVMFAVMEMFEFELNILGRSVSLFECFIGFAVLSTIFVFISNLLE